MHSSVCADDRNVFALKSSNRCSRDYDGGMNGSPDRAIARLVCKDRAVDYWMKKSRITVGRSSSKRSSADVDMGQSTFISRNHLEIYTTDARFYALVTGKNGLFVDDVFHKKGGSAFELPNTCLLRFPSTEIKIHFEVLLPEMPTSNADVKPYTCQDLQPIQTSVALKSNSYAEFYPTPNSNFNVLDGVLYPVKEEIVDHVMAADVDIGRFEQSSPDYNYMVQASQVKEEKEAAPPPPQKPLPAPMTPSSLTNEHTKPPYSYAQLIVQAITSQPDRQLTLSGIYNHITKQYPYYRHGDKGWQNSIRHNLSLNRYFVKVPRAQEEAGKGCFWRIDANSETALMSQAFRRRRQRQAPYCKTNSSEALQSPGLNASDSNTVIGTPDDSCASWEGPHTNGEELEAQPAPPPPEQTTQASEGTIRCFSSVNKPSFNAVSFAAVNLLASLPASINKSYIFAKPLPVSSAPNNAEQVVCSTPQSPIIISSQSNGSLSTQEIYTNTTGEATKVMSEGQDGKSKMLPLQLMSQPKTFILRSTPTNSLNFSMPAGSQLIKLSYAPQTATSKQVAPDHSPRAPADQNGENEADHSTERTAEGSGQGETMTWTKADASLAQSL